MRGLVVSPGFVDIQGSLGGTAISKITQGVTIEIAGGGWTEAPANDLTRAGAANTGRNLAEKPFEGPHGFDEMLRAAEKRPASSEGIARLSVRKRAPAAIWICSNSPPEARHIFAQVLRRSWGAIPGTLAVAA